MTVKVLVTYASNTGWTVGVAEAIGKALAENNAKVDVLPMQNVKDLSPYDAVVAGSAINGGAWLPEAMQFVRGYQAELKRKPFASFLVCMTLTTLAPGASAGVKNGGQYRSHVSSWLDPVRTLVSPVSEGLFAGGLDIRKISSFSDRLKFRLSVLFGVWQEGDHRDWDAIRKWAVEIKPLLIH
jgi:menaquinone-dependent protoporphyrinogen oxidase